MQAMYHLGRLEGVASSLGNRLERRTGMSALHQRHLRLHLVQVVLEARHVSLQVADVLQLPHPAALRALPVRDHATVRLPTAATCDGAPDQISGYVCTAIQAAQAGAVSHIQTHEGASAC